MLLLQGCVLDTTARGDAGKLVIQVQCAEGAAIDVGLDLDRNEQKERSEKRIPLN